MIYWLARGRISSLSREQYCFTVNVQLKLRSDKWCYDSAETAFMQLHTG